MNTSKKTIHHGMRVLLVGLFLFSGSMMVWAWNSLGQRSFSVSYGMIVEENIQEVWLLKLERDIDGNETDLPVSGAEFYLYDGNADERLSGPYVTDEEGRIVLHLPPGDYCLKETNLPPHYTFDIDEDGEPIRSYCFTVTGDETEPIRVTAYNRRLSGQLMISKVVEGDLEYHDVDLEFEFTVTFSDGGTYRYRIDDGPEQSLTSGGTLRLRGGERAIFERLPVGITYLVVETPVPGYTITSDNHQGTIIEAGNEVTFVNRSEAPSEVSGKLIVTKEVRGEADLNADTEFEFVASIDGIETRFTLRHDESKTFDNLRIGAPYAIWEIVPPGYIATPGSFTGFVLNQTVTLPFINHVETDSDEVGALLIGKIVAGEDIDPNQRSTFEVTLENLPDELEEIIVAGAPVAVTSPDHRFEVTLSHEETILIEDLPPGVIYTVEEQLTPGYTPGIAIQTGTIVAGHTVEAWFITERKVTAETTSLRIRKVVEGQVPEAEADRDFHFVLEIDGEVSERFTLRAGEERIFIGLPVGATYLVREVDLPDGYVLASVENGMGTLTDTEITVIFTNRYIHRIMIDIYGTKTWELNGHDVDLPEYIIVHLKRDGVITATARVTPDENNEWMYRFTVPKYDEDGNEIDYTIEEAPIEGWLSEVQGMDLINHYIPPVVSDDILVTKRITGDTPSEPHEFQFILQPRNNAPLPTNGNRLITILGEGQASFGTITFRQPGTYEYVIREVHTGARGYTYDTARYVLTFVVEEEDGKLVIASRTLTRDDVWAAHIVFVNVYTKDVTIEPEEPERPTEPEIPEESVPPTPPVAPPSLPRPPQTGDPTSILKWLILFIASATGLVINLVRMRRKSKKK